MTERGVMVSVEIYDPPMCCPSGLCGPTVDTTLVDTNEMVLRLRAEGIRVERYMMTQQPHAFLRNPEVFRLVRERQLAALPITTVNGRVVKVGAYPTLEEIREAVKNGANQ